jgi:hypothetical protein
VRWICRSEQNHLVSAHMPPVALSILKFATAYPARRAMTDPIVSMVHLVDEFQVAFYESIEAESHGELFGPGSTAGGQSTQVKVSV